MAENDTHYNGMPNLIYRQATPDAEGRNGNMTGGMAGSMADTENETAGGNEMPGTPSTPAAPSAPAAPSMPVPPLPAPGEGGPAFPGNEGAGTPMIPLPSPGEGGPVFPGNEGTGTPVIPLPFPGEGGPVFPGNEGAGTPVIPLPFPGEGGPVFPGPGIPGRPEFPTLPGTPTFPGIPSFPGTPSFPEFPNLSPQFFGQVRFLNASANPFPVNISIDGNPYAINSRFGTITNYDWVSDGFHTVTVRRATGMRSVLFQQNFPFVAGQKATMVLTDTAAGGLELIRVVDTGCSNMPFNSGCYRFANMTFSGSRFDLLLSSGETVFRNVGFQTVTSYKQAVAGSYQFLVTSSNTYTFLRELPIIIIGAIGTVPNIQQPLVSFSADINAGQNYTSYLVGNTWSDLGLRVITVED